MKNMEEEIFIDNVFGPKSSLPRKEWEDNVLATVDWIFDFKKVRQAVFTKAE